MFTRFGKIGATGQTTVKEFPDAAAAEEARDKAVAEKLKKGYVEGERHPLRPQKTPPTPRKAANSDPMEMNPESMTVDPRGFLKSLDTGIDELTLLRFIEAHSPYKHFGKCTLCDGLIDFRLAGQLEFRLVVALIAAVPSATASVQAAALESALGQIEADATTEVAFALAQNPSCSTSSLQSCFEVRPSIEMSRLVFNHPNVSEETKAEILDEVDNDESMLRYSAVSDSFIADFVETNESYGENDEFLDDPDSEDENTLACHKCGSDVVDGAKFCAECGSELVPTSKFCAECGAKREGSGKFCPDCGHQH